MSQINTSKNLKKNKKYKELTNEFERMKYELMNK